MDILSTFGERLEEMMFECGLSSYDVAGRTNIDVSGIRRYLRKASLPNLFNALKLADLFACSLDYLFGRTDDSYKTKFLPCPDFSERFKEVLQENNCTRYRLNKDTHIAERCIDDWYYGRGVPTVENLIELADYFYCTLDYLVGRET